MGTAAPPVTWPKCLPKSKHQGLGPAPMKSGEGARGLVATWIGMRWCTACRQKAVLRATAVSGKPGASRRLSWPSCCRLGRCLAWQQGQQRARPSDQGGGAGVCAEKWAHPHTSQGLTTPWPTRVDGTRELASSWWPPPWRGSLPHGCLGADCWVAQPPRSRPRWGHTSRLECFPGIKAWRVPTAGTAHCLPPPSFPSEMDNGQSASG